MNTNIIDREAAVQDIKDTAAEASSHSSGDVLNMANPNSRYAHGKFERTGSVNENTNMPTTNTTVAGAYDIGNTSTTDVTSNYDNKFTEPETHTVGTGSRTVQALPEEVHDLGSTVQTQRTTHVLQTQAEPVQYIAPQQHVSSFGTSASSNTNTNTNTGSGIPHSTGRTNLAGVAAAAGGASSHAHAQTGTGAAYESGAAYGSNNTTSTNTAADTLGTTTTTTTTSATHHDGGVSHHTTGLPAGQSGVVQHHGLVGENRTLEPTQAAYNVNAASGSAVGTGLLGMPHGTAGTAAGTTTTSTNHNSSTTTGAGHSDNAEKPQKESFLSKIKHALHK